MRAFVVAAFLLASTALLSAQAPTFKAPPGYQTKVEAVSKTYNFYGLTRTLDLPWNRLKLPESKVPAGNAESSNFKCPSADGTRLYNNPKGVLPSFGTPSKQSFQTYRGKDGDGAVLFFRYTNVLPKDAKEQLSKLFFGSATPPDPNSSQEVEQFLVNDHSVVVWCFKNVKSKVKEAHQEHMFTLISEVATASQNQK